ARHADPAVLGHVVVEEVGDGICGLHPATVGRAARRGPGLSRAPPRSSDLNAPSRRTRSPRRRRSRQPPPPPARCGRTPPAAGPRGPRGAARARPFPCPAAQQRPQRPLAPDALTATAALAAATAAAVRVTADATASEPQWPRSISWARVTVTEVHGSGGRSDG